MTLFELIGLFVFLYPLYMSIVWMMGGLIFSIRRERRKEPCLEYFPYFTVIVPAHDEEMVIEETVLNLKDLNYPNYEVIVVNDGSADATREILGDEGFRSLVGTLKERYARALDPSVDPHAPGGALDPRWHLEG